MHCSFSERVQSLTWSTVYLQRNSRFPLNWISKKIYSIQVLNESGVGKARCLWRACFPALSLRGCRDKNTEFKFLCQGKRQGRPNHCGCCLNCILRSHTLVQSVSPWCSGQQHIDCLTGWQRGNGRLQVHSDALSVTAASSTTWFSNLALDSYGRMEELKKLMPWPRLGDSACLALRSGLSLGIWKAPYSVVTQSNCEAVFEVLKDQSVIPHAVVSRCAVGC